MKKLLFFLIVTGIINPLFSHPIPDIPVIGSFYSDGNASIVVEIDPRSFAEDPESIPFITDKTFKVLPDLNKSDLILRNQNYILVFVQPIDLT